MRSPGAGWSPRHEQTTATGPRQRGFGLGTRRAKGLKVAVAGSMASSCSHNQLSTGRLAGANLATVAQRNVRGDAQQDSSRHRTLTVKHERGIQRVAYFTFAALLALVACSYWVSHRIDHGETPAFLSEGAASVVASICALIFYAAVALAAFMVIRAFYDGLTQPESGQKHEPDG